MNGIMATRLAQRGFTSGDTGLESPLGFCHVLADDCDLLKITEGLGERWLIEENSIKPFACGVVAHPAIDGILRHRKHNIKAEDVRRISLRVHPRVKQLTSNATAHTGLEGKFSVQHSVAVALLDGRAGPRQYTDERVRAGDVTSLRDSVSVHVDDGLRLDEAYVAVALRNGEERSIHVEHAVSSLDHPMPDEMLEDKVRDLVSDLPAGEYERLRDSIFLLEDEEEIGALAKFLK